MLPKASRALRSAPGHRRFSLVALSIIMSTIEVCPNWAAAWIGACFEDVPKLAVEGDAPSKHISLAMSRSPTIADQNKMSWLIVVQCKGRGRSFGSSSSAFAKDCRLNAGSELAAKPGPIAAGYSFL